jgi:hypothetical protein
MALKTTIDEKVDLLFPVGTVMQVWDNNIEEVKALIDSDYMKCMNGQTVSDAESLFNDIVLPDISEAYLMCSSDNINATKVGDSKSSLSHSHTLIHSHTSTHSHTVSSHTHALEAVKVYLAEKSSSEFYINQESESSIVFNSTYYKTCNNITSSSGSTNNLYIWPEVSGTGVTTSSGSLTTTSLVIDNESITTNGNTYTNNRQLRSVKCRYYVRVK